MAILGEVADTHDAVDALALLADDERLKVAGALVLGATSSEAVVAATGLAKRRALEALTRLEAGGLATREGNTWTLDLARLKEIAKDSRTRPEPDDVGDVDRVSASILRTFLRGGRLTQIPMSRSKRLVVLDHVARVFEIGTRYPEREVNAYLRAFHPDTAALRRYLVDEGFLSRENNVYWRTGGSVDL